MRPSPSKIPLAALALAALGLLGCGDDKSLVVGEDRTASSGGSVSGGAGGAGPQAGSGGNDGAGPPTGGGGTGNGPGPGPGSGPGPGTDCQRMAYDYHDALMGAQICMPGTPDPCTLMMPDDLLCGCPTFVNPARDYDVAVMNQLLMMAENCPRMCEPIGCRPTSGGSCMSEPNQNPPRPRCFPVP